MPCILLLWVWIYAFTPGTQTAQGNIQVIIPSDTGLRGIEKILATKNIVNIDLRFRLLALLMGVSNRLKAGEYSFTARVTPYQVLVELEDGTTVQRLVTIPEGANMYQVADILAADNWVDKDYFISLVSDPKFVHKLGINADNLEGYLFPETYRFEHGAQNTVDIIKTMANQTMTILKEIIPAKEKRPLKLSIHEIITLASIVEKETALPTERPLIAKVFLNRLKKGMRLQTDPTVIYGLSLFNGNLTKKDLRTPTPYNTYLIKGLPPGPICNPGRAALEAVLHPATESYLYFVSKNNGSHYFSNSLAEHNRAVAKYQKRR